MEKDVLYGQKKILKDMCMKEIGKMIKCMEKVCIPLGILKVIMVIGLKAICMEKEL